MVAYAYPPIISAGSEPVARLAKYLPDAGFEPIVLTTDRYGVTPADEAERVYRAADLAHRTLGLVRRRRTHATGRETQHLVPAIANESWLGRLRDGIMVPDTKMGWLLPAVWLGRRLIREYRPALIFSTSPPETAHLVAMELCRRSRLPWVADLRDGWLYEPPNAALRRPPLRQAMEGWLERRMASTARAIVAATEPIAEDLRRRYPDALQKVQTITNGYDASEFRGLTRRRPPNGAFLLVHTGSLASSRQGTSVESLFAGIATLIERDPETNLRVRLVGNVQGKEQAIARSYGLSDIVTFVPPVSRREAHQHQLDADALLLVTAPGQRSVATLKLFDYIGAGVPILALAEDNAAAAIVQQYQLGITVAPNDRAAIARALIDIMDRQHTAEWPGFAVAQRLFEWQRLAGQMAGVFDGVVAWEA